MLNVLWRLAQPSNDSNVRQAFFLIDEARMTTVEICQNQVRCMQNLCLPRIREQLLQWKPQLQRVSRSMRELVYALKKVVQLLKSCRIEGWVTRTLHRGESREDFKAVHNMLLQAMRLVHRNLGEEVGFGVEQGLIDSGHELEDAANNDLNHLCELPSELQQMLQSMLRGNITLDENNDAALANEVMIEHAGMRLCPQSGHLGLGTFGVVSAYKWRDCSVAVKELQRGNIVQARREMSIASFKHPNLVSVIGCSLNRRGLEEKYCIVMEKMDMDLSLVIKKHVRKYGIPPFKPEVSISIMIQIATGMSFLHSKNVIHRDLKPQNILIANVKNLKQDLHNLVVKIGDFGHSRVKFDLIPEGDLTPNVGTRDFKAPEVRNSSRYSLKADVYSYAMVCYHILAGDEQAFRLYMQGAGDHPPRQDNWNESLKELLQDCRHQDSSFRPDFDTICERLEVIRARVLM